MQYIRGTRTGTKKVRITPCRKEIPAIDGSAYLDITVNDTSMEEAPAMEILP